eukprot:PhM_4_TR1624/c0_g1_i1/m.63389
MAAATPYPYPVPNPPATDSNRIVGFDYSTLSVTDVLDRIREENELRAEKGEVWAFWIYFIVILGLIAYTMIPTLLCVHVFPRMVKEWKRRRDSQAASSDADGANVSSGVAATVHIDLRKWIA